jgi:hypothetical protein
MTLRHPGMRPKTFEADQVFSDKGNNNPATMGENANQHNLVI